MENNFYRANSFEVVGTLKDADVRTGVMKSGQEYVSVNATVTSSIKGETNEFEIRFFSSKVTKDGKESQLYKTYSDMKNYIGKRISVNGDIRENRYKSTRTNQMVSSQQLNGRFVRPANDSLADKGTFELGGFIVKSPVEKTNKDGEVYRYDVVLGQSNYTGNGMSMFTLNIDPSDRPIIAGVEGYDIGCTVKLNGELHFVNTTIIREDENSGFGEATVRTYTSKSHNFFIKGGSNPIDDDTSYTDEAIKKFINDYKARDVELSGGEMSTTPAAPATESKPKVTRRQASLI